ncbi:MAG TPA: MlaE family lipid ABC transporter permease subunit [Rhizomicrobium sp.]|nr:MlaE family lipid ABC transporter permease subunit [Rhizomicrobium sp.]
MRNISPVVQAEHPATLETERKGDIFRLIAGGDWVVPEAPRLDRELQALDLSGARQGEIDGSSIQRLDSTGAWLLLRTKHMLETAGAKVGTFTVPEQYTPLLETMDRDDLLASVEPLPVRTSFEDILERTGRGTIEVLKQGYELLGFLGRITVETFEAVTSPRRELPFPALIHQIEETGLTALPILGLLSFLLGVVIAYQGADQLRRFGAEIFTINLLGVSLLREIGVLITAIIVAGRSGSAFTAQIGTMRVNEEIDAMQTLGLNIAEVLVVPRVLGLIISLPLLTFYADVMGMIGGAVMTYFDLGITIPVFMRQLNEAITWQTLAVGLIKAPVFAFLIGLVGCFEGLRVERNAASVGKLTTRSVVESIFLVMVFDAGFSILFSVLGF